MCASEAHILPPALVELHIRKASRESVASHRTMVCRPYQFDGAPSELAPMFGSDDFRLSRSGRRHDAERDETMTEKSPAAGTGWGLLAMAGAEVEKVSKFVMAPAKAVGRDGVSALSGQLG
jgi:hypothetical protein